MPASSSVVNQTLTNYARGIYQDLRRTPAAISAERLAPIVPVAFASGFYHEFNDKNSFQAVKARRAVMGARKSIESLGGEVPYLCLPYGLKTGIDDYERSLSGGQADPLAIQEEKVNTLVNTGMNSRIDEIYALLDESVAAVGGVGNWSADANDPVKEINAQIVAIAQATRMMPNRIEMDLGSAQIIVEHPKIIARQPGAEAVTANIGQIARYLINPQIDINVAVLPKNTTNLGTTSKAKTQIGGGEVYIYYNSPMPTRFDPSFMKTFMVGGNSMLSVKEWREDDPDADMYAVDWTEVTKVVSTELVRRITVS